MLRRLQVLYHHGLLDRPRCQIDYYHRGGSRPMVYGLGRRGLALLREECDGVPIQVGTGQGGGDVSRLFLEHTLMVADILIAIEKAYGETTGRIKFVPFQNLLPEFADEARFKWTACIRDHYVGLIPDAVVALDVLTPNAPPERLICCLEADRGTMPVKRRSDHLSSITRKLHAYTALWKSGAFERQFGTKRLTVLIVTGSAGRLGNIQQAVKGLSHGQGLFLCCGNDDIEWNVNRVLDRVITGPRDMTV